MDGEIHSHSQRETAQNRYGHVEVLTDKSYESINQYHGENQGSVADHSPPKRTKVKSENHQDNHQRNDEPSHHVPKHLIVPNQVKVGDSRRFKHERGRMVPLVFLDGTDHGSHGLGIPTLELDPDVGSPKRIVH